MNSAKAVFLEGIHCWDCISAIAGRMDTVERIALDYVPWPVYPYKPLVHVSVAHNGECIFLKYWVTEEKIKAANNNSNEPVYEDSCVEFFISFNNEKEYYNLEFNCIGTCLAGFGKEKTGREWLQENIIAEIRYQAVLCKNDHGEIHWELTLAIPKSVFYWHPCLSLERSSCRVNFFKCGDKLPTKHFVCWSDITAPEPNFHLPDFFGQLVFQ